MKLNKRIYKSIYFSDGQINDRVKKDLTISFGPEDPLYAKCKDLNSSEIKKSIGIDSYRELQEKAEAEGRSLGNFIKYILREKLSTK